MVENRLAHERSSYLRSAAHQPVDWFPWGEEAFRKAKSEDKPILLDIGAVWCHWCHVIDRESYEDPEVARIINDRYVAVKVDRDERPDVDARYQQAVQALRGQGGWPLTAFLTPEGKVFYGGTYFPPEERHGLPAFRTVLAAVADHYRTKKAEARKEADSLHRALSSRLPMAGQEPLDEGLLFAVEEQLTSSFDPVHGGFNGAPKFPHAGTIEFLLARYWRSRKEPLKEVVTKTLREMALGGVCDQIGGGFHRYSVDARWIVPHFEKMAYDNAALLENYVHAYMLTGEPLFRDTALGILRWVDTTLSDRDCGGFYASQDADVGLDDDGDYFTWTLDELREALPEDAARVLARHYDVQKVGEMKERPARNVLWVDEGPGMIAKALGLSEEEVRATIREAKERLLAARNSRPVPFVDRAIYANWNGMFISAYLTAAAGLNVPAPREFALRTLDYLLQTMYSKDRGFAHQLVDGEAHVHGLLDDQVQMTRALLAAYEATGDPKYLEAAESVAGLLRTHWWDEVLGGFFDLAPRLIDDAGAETLKAPYKPVQDAPTPAPNAVAALVFGKLHAITGDETYRETQEGLLRTFAAQSRRYGGLFAGTFFLAVDAYVNPPAHVVVTGSRDDEAAVALHAAALSTYHPGRSVVFADGGHVPEAARAMMNSPLAKDGPVAFVCKGTACAPPTGDPEALRKILSTP